jgi:hypothetical protein
MEENVGMEENIKMEEMIERSEVEESVNNEIEGNDLEKASIIGEIPSDIPYIANTSYDTQKESERFLDVACALH